MNIFFVTKGFQHNVQHVVKYYKVVANYILVANLLIVKIIN